MEVLNALVLLVALNFRKIMIVKTDRGCYIRVSILAQGTTTIQDFNVVKYIRPVGYLRVLLASHS